MRLTKNDIAANNFEANIILYDHFLWGLETIGLRWPQPSPAWFLTIDIDTSILLTLTDIERDSVMKGSCRAYLNRLI